MDLALCLDRIMTPSERGSVCAHFTAQNPHWRGAHAADIIDAVSEADGLEHLISVMLKQHEGAARGRKSLFRMCFIAAYYVEGAAPALERIHDLMERFTATYPDPRPG